MGQSQTIQSIPIIGDIATAGAIVGETIGAAVVEPFDHNKAQELRDTADRAGQNYIDRNPFGASVASAVDAASGDMDGARRRWDKVADGYEQLGDETMKALNVEEYFYGFVNENGNAKYKGKLVQVKCFSGNAQRDAREIGLVSRHEICWGYINDWDGIPLATHKGDYLGKGICDFEIFDIPYGNADWMSKLDNSTPLTSITFPGSHDSGTAQSEAISSDYVRTQAYSIINQLILGVRVFDIRVTRSGNTGLGREDNDIWTHHGGSTNQNLGKDMFTTFKGEKLDRAVTSARLFLQAFPSETVVFVLSHETNVTWKDVYEKIIQYSGGNVVCDWQGDHIIDVDLHDHSLEVGHVRGKLIAINEKNTERHADENKKEENVGRNGTMDWNEMMDYLQYVLDHQYERSIKKLNRYVPALTPSGIRSVIATPKRLALDHSLPGLKEWLKEPVPLIGSVETDWFGSVQDVHDLIGLVINQNVFSGEVGSVKRQITPSKDRAGAVCGLAVHRNIELFLVRCAPTNGRVEVYGFTRFDFLRYIQIEGLGYVSFGLAVCSPYSCIYVADYNNRSIHRVDLTNEQSVTQWNVNNDGNDLCPVGLFVNNKHNLLIMASVHYDKPSKSQPNKLIELSVFGGRENDITLPSEIHDGQDVAELNYARYLVSYSGLPRGVCILDYRGRLLSNYTGHASGLSPSRMFLDLRINKGYIADHANGRIEVCSIDPLRRVADLSASLQHPHSLYFDTRYPQLVVSENNGRASRVVVVSTLEQ